jgi:haloalkane dehalogenase
VDEGRPAWLDARAWPFPTRGLDTPAGTVSVTDVGNGPALMFVHTGFWSFVWRDVLTRLRGEFRCVTLDSPGTGASARPRSSHLSLDLAGAAIGRVMDDVGEELTLVVHDLGAPAGLRAAADRPEQIAGLVVVNGFGWRPSGPAFRGMLAVMGSAPMREVDALTGFLPRAASTRLGVGRSFDRAERKVFRAGIDRTARRSFHRYLRSARRSDELFERIDAAVSGPLADRPVLTIFGERNDPLGFQPAWRDRYPRARQVVVPGGMHFPMCDDPTLVARSIATWHAETIDRA